MVFLCVLEDAGSFCSCWGFLEDPRSHLFVEIPISQEQILSYFKWEPESENRSWWGGGQIPSDKIINMLSALRELKSLINCRGI